MRFNEYQRVKVSSSQTAKNIGEVRRVEYDRVHGQQIMIAVPDKEMGEEMFWVRESEIAPLGGSYNRK